MDSSRDGRAAALMLCEGAYLRVKRNLILKLILVVIKFQSLPMNLVELLAIALSS